MSLADEIARYFAAERSGAWMFIAIGVISIALPLFLLATAGGDVWKGFAVPMVLIGLIQIAVGASVGLRAPSQVATINARVASADTSLRRDETDRMLKVLGAFKIFKMIEVAFIAVGLAGCLLVSQPIWLGIAMGMLIQGALMLPADIVAERRGAIYREALIGTAR